MIRFGVFVLVILAALYVLIPEARTAPGWLVALLALTSGWSVVALAAREVYLFDEAAGTIDVLRSSLLSRPRQRLGAADVAAVRIVTGGPDNDRLLVELVAAAGKLRLRMPRRLTTLSAAGQSEIGRLIAEQLGVPLRGEVSE